MRFDRPPSGGHPTPAGVLFEEAYVLYASAFRPLTLTAGIPALLLNILGLLLEPDSARLSFLWSLLIIGCTMGLLAAIMKLAILSREGQPLTAAAAFQAVKEYGLRYIAGSILILVAAGLLYITIVGIPIAIFLLVRLSLFGPALVAEDADITDAITRSWGLVRNRWWRTAGILLSASAPLFILSLLLFLAGPPLLIDLILSTAAWALIAPFITVLTLLLFEDYRRLADAVGDPFERPPDALR